MAESGKKRKRHEEGAPKPSKKVAIQAPSTVESVQVSVVQGTEGWAPVVGMFMPRSSELSIPEIYISNI
jgi:hypothetical protein